MRKPAGAQCRTLQALSQCHVSSIDSPPNDTPGGEKRILPSARRPSRGAVKSTFDRQLWRNATGRFGSILQYEWPLWGCLEQSPRNGRLAFTIGDERPLAVKFQWAIDLQPTSACRRQLTGLLPFAFACILRAQARFQTPSLAYAQNPSRAAELLSRL